MNSKDCYPGFERQKFVTYEEELKAVRGALSSQELETRAHIANGMAKAARDRLDILKRERGEYEAFAANEAVSGAGGFSADELRAEARRRAEHIAAVTQPAYENEARQKQERADDLGRMAEQACRFEARWSFNPYEPDSVERSIAKLQAELNARPKTGKSPKRPRC